MFCSTIIPTINRPSLSRAVNSVLEQALSADEFEVIVVNDSGQPLPQMDWQQSERVRVIHTNRRERSVARNTGAAVAKSRYLHFLDDDDMLLPGALEAFWELAQSGDAAWLYGGYQMVDDCGNLLGETRPQVEGNIFVLLIAGEAIPLGASLLDADLFWVSGAFDPRIVVTEDRDLSRRIAMYGTVAGTSATVARFRVGQQGSTTDWTHQAECDRRGRERALREPGAFCRLWASANSSYLHGRGTRAYLASALWNLQHKDVLTAASRAMCGMVFGGHHTFYRGFWRGIRTRIR